MQFSYLASQMLQITKNEVREVFIVIVPESTATEATKSNSGGQDWHKKYMWIFCFLEKSRILR
ncbi:hypothetical protein ABID99_003590 [Mucilaginibacter sp. OAE612]